MGKVFKRYWCSKIDSVIVRHPEFFKALDQNLQSISINDLKDYLTCRLVILILGALPEKYVAEAFKYSQLFSGAKERKPRWKSVIRSEQNAMGELLGLYVKKYFDSTQKSDMKKWRKKSGSL